MALYPNSLPDSLLDRKIVVLVPYQEVALRRKRNPRVSSARAFLHTRSKLFVWIPSTSPAFGKNTTVLKSNSLPNKISLILFIYFSYLFLFSSYLLVSFYIYYSLLFLFSELRNMPGCSVMFWLPLNISECSMFLVLSTALKHPKRAAIQDGRGLLWVKIASISFLRFMLNYLNSNCAEYLAKLTLKVFSLTLSREA